MGVSNRPPTARSPSGNINRLPNGDPLKLGILQDFIGFRVRRAHNHFMRKFYSKVGRGTLPAGRFPALVLIEANPGVSQSQLAFELGVDKAMIVALVDRLQRAGFIRREQSQQDKRRNQLFVTRSGASEIKRLKQLFMAHEENIRGALTQREITTLFTLLDKLADIADKK